MEKIDSFKVNHKLLNPGIYISRVDKVGKNNVTTFDIRIRKPNVDQPMSIESMHTIEHLGATYFRNLPKWKDKVVYFGPMGCQTGFYLILSGSYPVYTTKHLSVIDMIMNMFSFIVNFKGKKIPGSSAEECGNYKSHDLETAKLIAANMLVMYNDFMLLEYEYPTGIESVDKEAYIKREMYINRVHDRQNREAARKRGIKIAEEEKELFKDVNKIKKSAIQRWENDDVCLLKPEQKKNSKEHKVIEIDSCLLDSSTPLF